MGICHLKEPSTKFATVAAVNLALDDGSVKPVPTGSDNGLIGSILVDGKLLTQAQFDALYVVEEPVAIAASPLAQ